ncbi:signal peptide peptidase-domain-containing protein [Kockiozyma suomiensis]|uniref:signal peptide peptidase-domain-containing protein n=1 Tax=Kockiozyma suomiensis TaxID=1337062 RepID=UPI0033430D50
MNNISFPQIRLFEILEEHNVDPVILTYAILLVSASVVIYYGSHATLHRPDTALPADPKDPNFDPADLSGSSSSEKLAEEDAYLMPIMGGCMLVGMYYLIKKLDKKYIEMFLNAYFALSGVFAVATTFGSIMKIFARMTGTKLVRWRITIVENPSYEELDKLKKDSEEEEKNKEIESEREALLDKIVKKPSLKQSLNPFFVYSQFKIASEISKLPPTPEEVWKSYFTSADLLGMPIALAIVVGNWFTSNWILGNVIGASFAFSVIGILTIDSFKTGYIMLIGLFLYDIFFVFGTDVMVTVATTLTVPIKLTAPRPGTATQAASQAMLGLGDIIVPAIFLSLCLRFDSWNYYRKHPNTAYSSRRPFPKPFFNSAMVMYVIALIVTIFVMHVFKAAQPALLYLCPGIGGAVAVTAFVKGEGSILWGYKEISERDKEEQKKEEEKAKKLLEKEKEKEGEVDSKPAEESVAASD